MSERRKKISFWATKKVSVPVRVSFDGWDGRVSFKAHKKVSKRVKVSFFKDR